MGLDATILYRYTRELGGGAVLHAPKWQQRDCINSWRALSTLNTPPPSSLCKRHLPGLNQLAAQGLLVVGGLGVRAGVRVLDDNERVLLVCLAHRILHRATPHTSTEASVT